MKGNWIFHTFKTLQNFWGNCRGGLCGRRPGLPPCWTQPGSISSAKGPPQGTIEPISETGDTSVKTHLRKGIKCQKEKRREQEEQETAEETSRPREEKELRLQLYVRVDVPCSFWRPKAGAENVKRKEQ